MSDQTDTRPGLVRRILKFTFGFNRPVPQGESVTCPCGNDHAVPPMLATILASAQGRAASSAEVSGREWEPAFADRVKPNDVINIPRSEVAGRALRVLEVREHPEGGEFEHAARTFLAVDVADARGA